jgi:hypothetical protein
LELPCPPPWSRIRFDDVDLLRPTCGSTGRLIGCSRQPAAHWWRQQSAPNPGSRPGRPIGITRTGWSRGRPVSQVHRTPTSLHATDAQDLPGDHTGRRRFLDSDGGVPGGAVDWYLLRYDLSDRHVAVDRDALESVRLGDRVDLLQCGDFVLVSIESQFVILNRNPCDDREGLRHTTSQIEYYSNLNPKPKPKPNMLSEWFATLFVVHSLHCPSSHHILISHCLDTPLSKHENPHRARESHCPKCGWRPRCMLMLW